MGSLSSTFVLIITGKLLRENDEIVSHLSVPSAYTKIKCSKGLYKLKEYC